MTENDDVRYLRALRRVLLWASAAAAVALGAIAALLLSTGHASAQPLTIPAVPAIGSIEVPTPARVPGGMVAITPEISRAPGISRAFEMSPAREAAPAPRTAQSIVGHVGASPVSGTPASSGAPASISAPAPSGAPPTVATILANAVHSIAPDIDIQALVGMPGLPATEMRAPPMTPHLHPFPELRAAPPMPWGPETGAAPAIPQLRIEPQLHSPTPLFAYPPMATPHKSHGEMAVEAAESKLGSTYRYGSAGPDRFDCSGLVQWSYRQAGVDVPRTSYAQLGSGTPVALDDLQPGDLVSFYGGEHSALYVGDGKVIHASGDGIGVVETPMKYMPVAGARRF